ncbi:uncharacterized protein LOC111572973 isoform X2 [Amphiprion ocellaris]|uniref:uncharacterized protein LOC111572973 isoform X2 n=1 Tax=Amphiprion ocellaris TaxID=80972 RepID=UPI002411903A|nr:uncharacterized protein LOC111572973 isoform X2 [Amphiprion ocellaris]
MVNLWNKTLIGVTVDKNRKDKMRKKRKVSHVCLLLLALLHIGAPSSAQNITTSAPDSAGLSYRTRPVDVLAAVGQPAEFRCGVPETSPNLTFTFYGSHGNYSLTCPQGHVEDIPEALYGSCDMKNGESLAVWSLRGTSFPDNGTKVVCQQLNNRDAITAVLRVYDDGATYSVLIGCVIGGFFGILLVFGLLYAMLYRSESFWKCFGGTDTEDDMTTIVTKD